MQPFHVSIVFCASLARVLAQTVTASLSAPTPLVVSIVDGATTVQATQPAGPLGSGGAIQTTLPGTSVSGRTSWTILGSGSGAGLALHLECDLLSNSATSIVHAGPQQFVIQFAASAPVVSSLSCTRSSSLSVGAPWPNVQLDFGNDGTIDVVNLGQGSVAFPAAPITGTQPMFVRVIFDAQIVGVGNSSTTLDVGLVPENDVAISTIALGCDGLLAVYPVFPDRGIDIQATQLFPALFPTILVLGLQAQPVLLSVPILLPCILVPSPDVLLMPPLGKLHIPLPPAVRPLGFYVQGVTVAPSALLTTAAYHVFAL